MKITKETLNKDNVFISDMFILNFYGIIVIFEVSKTNYNEVYLTELEMVRYKNGVKLSKSLKAAKNPLVVPSFYNTRTKTEFNVETVKLYKNEPWLSIYIDEKTPIYQKALDMGEYPTAGTWYATPIKNCLNTFWISEQLKKKHKNKELESSGNVGIA